MPSKEQITAGYMAGMRLKVYVHAGSPATSIRVAPLPSCSSTPCAKRSPKCRRHRGLKAVAREAGLRSRLRGVNNPTWTPSAPASVTAAAASGRHRRAAARAGRHHPVTPTRASSSQRALPAKVNIEIDTEEKAAASPRADQPRWQSVRAVRTCAPLQLTGTRHSSIRERLRLRRCHAGRRVASRQRHAGREVARGLRCAFLHAE